MAYQAAYQGVSCPEHWHNSPGWTTGVLVGSGCYKKTKHRLGGLHTRKLFLTVLEAERFQIMALASLVSDEGLLPGLWMAVSSHDRDRDYSTRCDRALAQFKPG